MQNSLTYSKITKVYLSCDLAIPFLHVHPRKTKIYVHTKTCTIMYTHQGKGERFGYKQEGEIQNFTRKLEWRDGYVQYFTSGDGLSNIYTYVKTYIAQFKVVKFI